MEENIAVQNSEIAPNVEANPAQGFDALLREKNFQSEFDRRVSRALETARGKWAQETERRIQQARAAAEERARMTGEERMAHDFAQRQQQLDEREQALNRRELQAEALRMLAQRGLPPQLAGAMDFSGAQQLQASLDAAEEAFRSAVQAGVEERMRGSVPSVVPRKAAEKESDADYYARTQAGR